MIASTIGCAGCIGCNDCDNFISGCKVCYSTAVMVFAGHSVYVLVAKVMLPWL